MYLHHDKRLCFLASPRTGSKAVAQALGEVGFVNVDGRPARADSSFPHHMTVERSGLDLDAWVTFTFVRNHWDAVVSWICGNYGQRSVAHEGWSAEHVEDRLGRISWVGDTTMWHLHLPAAQHVLRYERLEDDLRDLLTGWGLSPPPLELVQPTPQRAGRPYQVFYTAEGRDYVGERFADEIERLGYRYEELEGAAHG